MRQFTHNKVKHCNHSSNLPPGRAAKCNFQAYWINWENVWNSHTHSSEHATHPSSSTNKALEKRPHHHTLTSGTPHIPRPTDPGQNAVGTSIKACKASVRAQAFGERRFIHFCSAPDAHLVETIHEPRVVVDRSYAIASWLWRLDGHEEGGAKLFKGVSRCAKVCIMAGIPQACNQY